MGLGLAEDETLSYSHQTVSSQGRDQGLPLLPGPSVRFHTEHGLTYMLLQGDPVYLMPRC